MTIEEQAATIISVNQSAKIEAKRRWDSIAKPLGSLGKLETAVIKIAGMIGDAKNISLEKPALVVMCSDHGVVEEGVTQTGFEVTKIVAENFTTCETSVAVMAKEAGVDLFPIDIGMNCEAYQEMQLKPSVLLNRKIAKGTKNFVKEAAMTEAQCREAIQVGIDVVAQLKSNGYQILATGEMGIGNTTPSSALTAVILQKEVEEVTGRGAGLSNDGLQRKIHAIKEGIRRYKKEEKKNTYTTKEEAIHLLAQLGGYDIAGMTGLFLGGAMYHIPVLVDGFISAVAALVAIQIEPKVTDYILASHLSKEPAGAMLIKALGGDPFLDCHMCLGEGTGAVAVIPLLQMAVQVYQKMSTFQEISIEEYKPFE